MTDLERIAETRSNYILQRHELSDPLTRRPNYSIGGRSVSWSDYMRFLTEQIALLDAELAAEDGEASPTVTAIE